jgi:hypothetical protein
MVKAKLQGKRAMGLAKFCRSSFVLSPHPKLCAVIELEIDFVH